MEAAKCDVSIILPIHNGEQWLEECLQSISEQKHELMIELSIFLDSCTDGSQPLIEAWSPRLVQKGFEVTLTEEHNLSPKGVGYARNKAILQSKGEYLCFMDSDDIMHSERVQTQFNVAMKNTSSLVGSKFIRIPEDSTKRYSDWANSLTPFQLNHQIFTSHGPTIIMPTWFCNRNTFLRVGKFSETGHGTPEDLLFFHNWLSSGNTIIRCEQVLLTYRYHHQATTFSIKEETIWNLRLEQLKKQVLARMDNFTIWNAGKQGRRLYRSLSPEMQLKVSCFCDVDVKKIGKDYVYEHSPKQIKPKVPIVHFHDAKPPFIICVKMGLTEGVFESNLASLNLEEGKDYVFFS